MNLFKRKKQDNNEPEMENFIDVIKRNCNANPSFKALVKLIGYLIFIFTLMFLIIVINPQKKENNKNQTTSTNTQKSLTYKDILEDTKTKDLNIKINVKINEDVYLIEAVNKQGIINGYLETEEGTHKFKLIDGKILENILGSEKENMGLFADLKIDFIIPANLIDLLMGNRSYKSIDGEKTIYSHEITKDDIKYAIKNTIKDDIITNIDITCENATYNIAYE